LGCVQQRARLRTEKLRFAKENIASEAFLLRLKRMLDPHRIPPAPAQKNQGEQAKADTN
jgi:hypothetical protein